MGLLKKIETSVKKTVVAIQKKVIAPIEKKIVAPVIKQIETKVIAPVTKAVIAPMVKGIKTTIIKPIEKKIKAKVVKKKAPKPPKAIKAKVEKETTYATASEPKYNKVTLSPVVVTNDALINTINNPTIPNNYINNDYNLNNDSYEDNLNPNIITYLDNDIYYTNNKQKESMIAAKPKSHKSIRVLFIILMSILGLLVFYNFVISPKEYWNILIVYILLFIALVKYYDINKKYLFVDKII